MQLSATLVKGKARIKFDAPKVYNFEKKYYKKIWIALKLKIRFSKKAKKKNKSPS